MNGCACQVTVKCFDSDRQKFNIEYEFDNLEKDEKETNIFTTEKTDDYKKKEVTVQKMNQSLFLV